MNVKHFVMLYAAIVVLAACQSVSSTLEVGSGATLTTATQTDSPSEYQAVVFTLDDTPVSAGQSRFRLNPGSHKVTIWVREVASSRHQPATGDLLEVFRFEVGETERVSVELRSRRYRTAVTSLAGQTLVESPWREMVYPVLVRHNGGVITASLK